MPVHHRLVWIEGDFGWCLCVRGDELQRSFEEDFAGVDGVGGTGLGASSPGPGRHRRRLVAPVPVHGGQDVVGQGVEVDPRQVRRPLRRLAVLLQDPEEDVTDHPNIRNATPGGQRGMGTRSRLGEEQQLLFIQPDGVHQGKDLLTETGNSGFGLPSGAESDLGFLPRLWFLQYPAAGSAGAVPTLPVTALPQAGKNYLAKKTFHLVQLIFQTCTFDSKN